MRPPRAVFMGLIVAAGLWTGTANAYPQWQFSSGVARCDQCHFSPDGGGLPNGYGRDAEGEEESTFGGDGAFLHGAVTLPGWAALGGDFRGAFVRQDVQDPNGPTDAVFPMQADVEGRLDYRDLSIYGVGGLRGQVRSNEDIVPIQNYQPITASQLISREHYAMWRPSAVGSYVRVGRFFAPFGLRLAEHILYIRRDLGFDEMQETYNLSGGYVTDEWELHLTAFAPDFVRHLGSNEQGFAAYFEHRILGETASIAPQARVASAPGGVTRLIVGGAGKLWSAPLRTLFMAEGDFVHREINDVGASNQFVGAAGGTVMPVKGLMLTFLGERNQVDLRVQNAAWNAATALVSWFPYAHVEIQLMERLQFPAGGQTANTFLAQIHYFL